jgi:hypothetical protein
MSKRKHQQIVMLFLVNTCVDGFNGQVWEGRGLSVQGREPCMVPISRPCTWSHKGRQMVGSRSFLSRADALYRVWRLGGAWARSTVSPNDPHMASSVGQCVRAHTVMPPTERCPPSKEAPVAPIRVDASKFRPFIRLGAYLVVLNPFDHCVHDWYTITVYGLV